MAKHKVRNVNKELTPAERIRHAEIRLQGVCDRVDRAVESLGRNGRRELVPVREDDRQDGEDRAVPARAFDFPVDDLIEEGAGVRP